MANNNELNQAVEAEELKCDGCLNNCPVSSLKCMVGKNRFGVPVEADAAPEPKAEKAEPVCMGCACRCPESKPRCNTGRLRFGLETADLREYSRVIGALDRQKYEQHS